VQRYRASDATLMATYDNLLDDLMAIEPGP
jgi:hypothetical protein